MLIIICGLPGSGKSTISKKLKSKINSIYFSSDILRKKKIASPIYSEEEKIGIYMELLESAKKHIDNGQDVIVDATFSKEEYRKIARQSTANYKIIECVLKEEIILSRLRKRMENKNGISDAGVQVYIKMKKEFEPIKEKHLILDCSMPMKQQMEIVLEYLYDN